ncbi:hypothetical protein QFZ60_000596 [Arthrobacter sp. B2I5]|uniref:hypothetical protein n=1 Tax=Arthrobacter sp. B2I5 TaxID=3042266 RepID=UPI00278B1B0C|nr:hypothetical protein [Arthrobacter sp. B2I5]MDQ0824423.1 hypothetical protein [Arthrobacter sp. B2I5]
MDDKAVRRITGWAAVGMVVFWAAQFPLYLAQDPAVGIYDGAGGAAEAYRIRTIIFTRVLIDLCLYVAAMVFAAGLGHLIRRADLGYGWAGSLVVAAMAVWVGVTLVANGLEGGLALDAMAPDPDPSVNRALTMGYMLIYNSSIAFAITGLFLGAAGWAAAATGVLPSWTRWVAYAGVLLCAAAVPSMYGGPLDPSGFYNAAGWGPVIIANLPPAVWFVLAAALLLRSSAPVAASRRSRSEREPGGPERQ